MLAALWQGELVAALGAVAEDGISVAYTRTKTAEISSLKLRHSYEGIAAFFEMLLEKEPCADGGAGEYS